MCEKREFPPSHTCLVTSFRFVFWRFLTPFLYFITKNFFLGPSCSSQWVFGENYWEFCTWNELTWEERNFGALNNLGLCLLIIPALI